MLNNLPIVTIPSSKPSSSSNHVGSTMDPFGLTSLPIVNLGDSKVKPFTEELPSASSALVVQPSSLSVGGTGSELVATPGNASSSVSHNTTSGAAFDIRKLYQREEKRDTQRKELYDSIVRKIHHRVETVTQRSETQCLYEVPQFVLGMPLYDPFQCTGYVIQTLKAQGFHVRYYNPNMLHVNWSRHLIEPFVQAMDRRESSRAKVEKPTYSSPSLINSPSLDYKPTGVLFGR